jgi:threonylcarbamoyladenosine tRNA methylthiotransferase MtaB
MSVDVLTFGCRLNTYESEVIRRHAVAAGLADVVVVNTCAVTAEAERQARQAIRRAKRERPQARIIVTGCAAQTNPDQFAAMAEVDRVIGNDDKIAGEAWIAAREALAQPPSFGIGGEQKIVVNDIMSVKETAAHLIEGVEGVAALCQVRTADHRCTFCIIPFGRGNSRSVPMGDGNLVRRLADNGYARWFSPASSGELQRRPAGRPKLGTLVRQILRHVGTLARRLSQHFIEIDDGYSRSLPRSRA